VCAMLLKSDYKVLINFNFQKHFWTRPASYVCHTAHQHPSHFNFFSQYSPGTFSFMFISHLLAKGLYSSNILNFIMVFTRCFRQMLGQHLDEVTDSSFHIVTRPSFMTHSTIQQYTG
jgi:hypothetical protein